MVWDGLAMVWRWSGDGLAMVWDGLAMVWRWSGDGLVKFRLSDGLAMVWDGLVKLRLSECLGRLFRGGAHKINFRSQMELF